MRPRRPRCCAPSVVLAASLAATAFGLAGCARPGTGGGPSSPSPASTELTVVATDGTGAQTTWTLTCDPPGGTHPDPTAACRALTEHGADALAPVRKDVACTMIYGGPEKATVTGTWRGETVDASLSRSNGCEIDRWDQLEGLVPSAGR